MTASRPSPDPGAGAYRFGRSGIALLTVLAAVAIFVPVLNRVVPPSSSLHLSTYALTLIVKYMC